MIVITSADYIKQDLQVEFGAIPPSFLPLGNKRLYEYQIASLNEAFNDNTIILSLPNSYTVSEQDYKRLGELGVEIIFVPEGISLAESILYVINSKGYYQESIKILHGDTLIEDLPLKEDVIGISPTHYEYNWEFEKQNNKLEDSENLVWCGFFSFTDTPLLIRSLTVSRNNFVQAVREYDMNKELSKESIKVWYDFGHANTYYKSRSIKTTEREFNSLSISQGYVKKTGIKEDKIVAEYNWFQKVPWEIKRFTPQLLDCGINNDSQKPYYILEYLSANPLNELYVYGENSSSFWAKMFEHCNNFLELCEDSMDSETKRLKEAALIRESEFLLEEKTYTRLEEYKKVTGFDLKKEIILNGQVSPSLLDIANLCISEAKKDYIVPGILHGDFCFSNILYDSRADFIKVIDPRGFNSFEKTIYGDLRYDLAKLTHSVIGLYDYIVAGVMDFKVNSTYNMDLAFYQKDRVSEIQNIFMQNSFINGKLTVKSIMPITILLFISMLPLHSDNEERQRALLANAVRLFNLYQEDNYDCNTNGGKKLTVF